MTESNDDASNGEKTNRYDINNLTKLREEDIADKLEGADLPSFNFADGGPEQWHNALY